MAKLVFIVYILVLNTVSCRNLSPNENRKLQKTCFHVIDAKDSTLLKSHGGIELTEHSLPWVSYVGIYSKDRNGFLTCSGTQISSRHILTAAHCVTKIIPDQSDTRDESTIEIQEDLLITTGSSCLTPKECITPNVTHYKPVKITVVREFDNFYHMYADLAVIEVDREIPKSEGRPVCLPRDTLPGGPDSMFERTQLKKILYGAGYGVDINKDDKNLLQLFRLVPVFEADNIYAKGLNSSIRAQGADHGDSGSGLVQIEDDGRLVVVGIVSSSDGIHKDMDSIAGDSLDILTDVRKYSTFICVYTGVCAGPEANTINKLLLPRASIKIIQPKTSN